jgi:hypothetical protein
MDVLNTDFLTKINCVVPTNSYRMARLNIIVINEIFTKIFLSQFVTRSVMEKFWI